MAAASENHTIRVWEAASGKLVTILRRHTDKIIGVNFSSDNKWLASASAGLLATGERHLGGRHMKWRAHHAKQNPR